MGRLILYSPSLSANAREGVAIAGTTIRCLSATGSFRIETDQGDLIDMAGGLEVQPATAFRAFSIEDTSGATNTIRLAVGIGIQVWDSRTSIVGSVTVNQGSQGSESWKVRELRGATIAQAAVTIASTATLILASRAGRTSLLIRSDIDNSARIFLGDSAVTTANGTQLNPGEAFAVEGTMAVYGIVASGTQPLRYWEGYQ